MPSLKIDLFAAHSLASAEYAEKTYEILNASDFQPDGFDKYEPVRTPWANRGDFLSAWQDEATQYFGQVLIRRKKRPRYYAHVVFQFGPNRKMDNKPPYHGFSVYDVKESECRGDILNNLVGLADRLFSALDMDYGFICRADEYEAKNIIKNLRHADGSLEPRHVVGMKWPYCLPGLYWVNYYGRKYLEQGFASRADEFYPESVTVIDGGIRFQISDDPAFFQSAEAPATEERIRETLGKSWFFDRSINRDCDAIDVSLEELRSPDG